MPSYSILLWQQHREKTRKNWKRHPDTAGESYYDIWEDWELIESSFAKQYGIRIRQEDDMSYSEFCSLLSGLMEDTPLGRIVAIRSEKDKEVIKKFTPEQKRIRNEWLKRKSEERRQNPEAYKAYWAQMQMELKNAFYTQK